MTARRVTLHRWIIGAAVLAGVLLALYAFAHFYGRSILYHPSRDVVAPDMPDVSAERITTEDGETLVAWYAPPPTPDAPIFLFFDGNGGRPQIWNGRWRRIIEHAGFLAVYYRGYSGSTGSPTEEGLRRDARAGYEWLIAHDYEPRDIVIHGFSLGSAVAVQLAAEKPARALILEAPMTGVDDIAAEHGAGMLAHLMRDSFRSRDYIGRVDMPVLIVHGDRDTVIAYAQGERLFSLANEPKTFVRMEGSDHATLVRDGIYPHIWDFLAQHPAE